MLVDSTSHESRSKHMGGSSRSASKRRRDGLRDEPLPKKRKTDSAKKGSEKKRNSEKKKGSEPIVQDHETKQEVNDAEQNQGPSRDESSTNLNIMDLDLDVSYVGKVAPLAPSVRGQRERWMNPGPTINDEYNVPPGWHEEEPDLDPEDFNAQILRCQERISDRIMPGTFEIKMEAFKKQKQKKEATLAKYPELDESSAFRLEALQSIQEWLEDPKNDEPKQLGNVKALIDAYRSKNLTWNQGLVTYWINGVQRSQPRPFKLEEFWYLGREHGYTSFWVEGINGPGLPTMGPVQAGINHFIYTRTNTNSGAAFTKNINLTLSPPPQYTKMITDRHGNEVADRHGVNDFKPATWKFEFMHDTGADFMMIYEDDLRTMQRNEINQGKRPSPVFPIGTTAVRTFNGIYNAHIYAVTARIEAMHSNTAENAIASPVAYALTTWDTVFTIVRPGSINDPGNLLPRIDGPWIRYKLWTATVPDGAGEVHVASSITALSKNISTAPGTRGFQPNDYRNIPYPPMGPPSDPPPFGHFPPNYNPNAPIAPVSGADSGTFGMLVPVTAAPPETAPQLRPPLVARSAASGAHAGYFAAPGYYVSPYTNLQPPPVATSAVPGVASPVNPPQYLPYDPVHGRTPPGVANPVDPPQPYDPVRRRTPPGVANPADPPQPYDPVRRRTPPDANI